MIELAVPVEQIPYIRTIEGRKFHNGKWQFPDTAIQKLIQVGLIPSDTKPEEKKFVDYKISPFLREYQKKIVNTALNHGCYGIFSDTGTGKTVMGLEIADHYNKSLILCPLSVIETAWIDDCHRFYPNKKIIKVWSDRGKLDRLKLLNESADIYVMNYESFKIITGTVCSCKLYSIFYGNIVEKSDCATVQI